MKESEIFCRYIYFSHAIPKYSGKDSNFIGLGLFLFQKCLFTAEFAAFVMEDPKYSFYLGLSIILFLDHAGEGNSKYLGLSSRSSNDMAKLPTSEQENPNFWNWTAIVCTVKILIKISYDAFQLCSRYTHYTVYIAYYMDV